MTFLAAATYASIVFEPEELNDVNEDLSGENIIDLRLVDHTSHSLLAMSWNSTVEPNGLSVVDDELECIWVDSRRGRYAAAEEA